MGWSGGLSSELIAVILPDRCFFPPVSLRLVHAISLPTDASTVRLSLSCGEAHSVANRSGLAGPKRLHIAMLAYWGC